MNILGDLLRHAAARRVLNDPDAGSTERADARESLGLSAIPHSVHCYPCKGTGYVIGFGMSGARCPADPEAEG